MPTDVIKTIAATSSPTTPDYSTLAAWEAFVDGVGNLVSADERHIGECLDQGTFTTGLIIGGQTVDSTRYVFLRCATGASFKDKAGVRTAALTFNSANGVTISGSNGYVQMGEQYIRLEGIQVYRTSYGNSIIGSQQNCRVDSCIVRGGGPGTAAFAIRYRSAVVNTLIEHNSTANTCVGGDADFYGCTLVNIAGAGSSVAFENMYNQGRIKNCAVFGFSDFSANTPETGTDYNATDLSSVGAGSNNLTSLTFANQFENSTNDFRAKSTGNLQAGTPDTTNTPDDITGLSRDATTPWIGCWEVSGGGGGTDVSVDVPAGVLAFTGVAPTAARTAAVPPGSASLAGVPPVIARTAAVPAASIALAGVAPTASRTASVPAGSLTLTGVPPTAQIAATVSVGAITFVGNGLSSDGSASVPAGAISFAGVAPTAARTAAVPVGSLTIDAGPRNEIQEIHFGGATSGNLFISCSGIFAFAVQSVTASAAQWQSAISNAATVTAISGGLRFTFNLAPNANTDVPQITIDINTSDGTPTVATVQNGRGYPVTAEYAAAVPAWSILFTAGMVTADGSADASVYGGSVFTCAQFGGLAGVSHHFGGTVFVRSSFGGVC